MVDALESGLVGPVSDWCDRCLAAIFMVFGVRKREDALRYGELGGLSKSRDLRVSMLHDVAGQS